MEVYRLCRTKWASDLLGEGARLHGGRWNRKGTACLYTSESRALAVLEYTVNISIDDIPRALSMVTLEIPENFEGHPIEKLPGNWRDSPAPVSTRDYGTRALMKAESHVIRFPSAVIPEEFNFIINPLHPDHKKIKILAIDDFIYDIRIKST